MRRFNQTILTSHCAAQRSDHIKPLRIFPSNQAEFHSQITRKFVCDFIQLCSCWHAAFIGKLHSVPHTSQRKGSNVFLYSYECTCLLFTVNGKVQLSSLCFAHVNLLGDCNQSVSIAVCSTLNAFANRFRSKNEMEVKYFFLFIHINIDFCT